MDEPTRRKKFESPLNPSKNCVFFRCCVFFKGPQLEMFSLGEDLVMFFFPFKGFLLRQYECKDQ